MAQPVNVNFKLDADVKKRMEWACSELGLSMSFTLKVIFVIWNRKRGRLMKERRILRSMT